MKEETKVASGSVAVDLDKLEALAVAYLNENNGSWYNRFELLDGVSYESAVNFIIEASPNAILSMIALARSSSPAVSTENEGIWPWAERAEAATEFMRNYSDANMKKLLGGYDVQPIIRRLAAAIKEWQADAIRPAPDGVIGIEIAQGGNTSDNGSSNLAAPASQAQAAPTGYKLLPIESTGLMDTAGMMALRNLLGDTAMRDDAEACYRAMIEAAPAAPAVIDQPTAAEIRAKALEEAIQACENERVESTGTDGDAGYNMAIRHCKKAIRALASKEAAPAEVPSQWISVEDSLPEIDYSRPEYSRYQKVLVSCAAGVLAMNYISNGFAATERGRKPRWEYEGRIAPWSPTHWMPLPAAPVQSRTQGESGGEE